MKTFGELLGLIRKNIHDYYERLGNSCSHYHTVVNTKTSTEYMENTPSHPLPPDPNPDMHRHFYELYA